MLGNFIKGFSKGLIGNSLGGGFVSDQIGSLIGKGLESLIINDFFDDNQEIDLDANRMSNLFIQSNCYGRAINLIFGQCRISGNIIWALPIKEVASDEYNENNDEDFEDSEESATTIEYEYFASFAIGLCSGIIDYVSTVWVNNNIVDISQYNYRIYYGTEDQPPDPLISAHQGKSLTPAFRGLAYIVFEELPLKNFGNKIPNFSFEVSRRSNTQIEPDTIDLIENIIMMPGSGEFVYDTDIITKKYASNNIILSEEAINKNNHSDFSDAVFSLHQLMHVAKNISWISPVVSWFIKGLDVNLDVTPCVEYKDIHAQFSKEWTCANFTRENAALIGRDANDNPRYGGTSSDESIVNYVKYAKSLGFKIMFYPMLLIDVEAKPWRGYLSGTAADIVHFFNKQHGYNNFILHYAKLVRGLVDAFLIGSEFVSLNKVMNSNNESVAANCFINLATQVRGILGKDVLISYAADWSEYHHTTGGWHHLDALWANKNIDFIGIDNYFPLTDTSVSEIEDRDIKSGLKGGEGHEYYWNNDKRNSLSADYAWKNLEHWWSSEHYNPDGNKTLWQAKLKPIWFTELGFPSIDKATNQPNIFYDPECQDGGSPKHSNSEVDFSIQQQALDNALKYYKNSAFIERIFIWTWDVRPYPAWPHSGVWSDGANWERGHWIQNKLAGVKLSSIFAELAEKAGISVSDIDLRLDAIVQGINFSNHNTIKQIFNMLHAIFGIEQRSFHKLLYSDVTGELYNIDHNILLKNSSGQDLEIMETSKSDWLGKIGVVYQSRADQYQSTYATNNNFDLSDAVNGYYTKNILHLNIVLSANEATSIANRIHNRQLKGAKIYIFALPINYLFIRPNDLIALTYYHHYYLIKIINIKIDNFVTHYMGISY